MQCQMMETPLSRATHNGHIGTVRYLLAQGADVNCLDLVRLRNISCSLADVCRARRPVFV